MERGFNDDELADIMSEIESLEQDFNEEDAASSSSDSSDAALDEGPVAEVVESSAGESGEEIENKPLPKLSANDASEVEVPEESQSVAQAEAPMASVTPLVAQEASKQSAATHSSMDFHVSGELALNLGFNVSGQQIKLQVNAEGLEIQLESGAKFTIPVEGKAHKNAA